MGSHCHYICKNEDNSWTEKKFQNEFVADVKAISDYFAREFYTTLLQKTEKPMSVLSSYQSWLSESHSVPGKFLRLFQI